MLLFHLLMLVCFTSISGANGMTKGVSGPTLGQSGGNIENYGTDGAQTNAMGQRRPHTAHGGRAGFPSSSAPIAGGVYGAAGDPSKQGAMYNDGGEEVSSCF